MKNFLTPKDNFPPIRVKVFSKYDKNDYDKLDALASKRGYFPIELTTDSTINPVCFSGLQNSHLHSGWIATVDDYDIKANSQIENLKAKINECQNRKEKIIIGFCQTGHFSIGYSIYVKRQKTHSAQLEHGTLNVKSTLKTTTTHRDYAEIVANRLCVTVDSAEKALRTLDDIPQKAFKKLAEMGDNKALEYILNAQDLRDLDRTILNPWKKAIEIEKAKLKTSQT